MRRDPLELSRQLRKRLGGCEVDRLPSALRPTPAAMFGNQEEPWHVAEEPVEVLVRATACEGDGQALELCEIAKQGDHVRPGDGLLRERGGGARSMTAEGTVPGGVTGRARRRQVPGVAEKADQPLGISGLLDLAGLGLWALEIGRIVRRRQVASGAAPAGAAAAAVVPPVPLAGAAGTTAGATAAVFKPLDTIRKVVEADPAARGILAGFGLAFVERPVLPPIADRLTLREACVLRDIPEEQVMAGLTGVPILRKPSGGHGLGKV